MYIWFIDYTKAFDRVKHSKVRECLSEIRMDDKDLQIIAKLYWEQSASVRTESGITSEFKIKKGVRQGCVLSPNLFKLYTEKMFREVEDMKGVNIGGVNINNLRCVDDAGDFRRKTYHLHFTFTFCTVLLAEVPMFLQALLTAVNEKGKPYGMKRNKIKTKSMVISRQKPVPNISKCQYFGHIIRGDGVQRLLMEGRIYGRRGRGRPRTMWTDNIKEWTKIS